MPEALTTFTLVPRIEVLIERGLPCARHAPLGEGCVKDCRRCLTACEAKATGVLALLRRWRAGYWQRPIVEREMRVAL